MTTKTVTLYSVRVNIWQDIEIISVEAEEKPLTYLLRQRKGGGFRYNQVIHKADFLARDIAFTKSAAVALFVSRCQKRIESSLATVQREKGRIHAAEALLAETERKV